MESVTGVHLLRLFDVHQDAQHQQNQRQQAPPGGDQAHLSSKGGSYQMRQFIDLFFRIYLFIYLKFVGRRAATLNSPPTASNRRPGIRQRKGFATEDSRRPVSKQKRPHQIFCLFELGGRHAAEEKATSQCDSTAPRRVEATGKEGA